jgi:hypothetical protein
MVPVTSILEMLVKASAGRPADAIYCRTCGRQLPPDARYCGYCGIRVP